MAVSVSKVQGPLPSSFRVHEDLEEPLDEEEEVHAQQHGQGDVEVAVMRVQRILKIHYQHNIYIDTFS